jgi:hypothetical protein
MAKKKFSPITGSLENLTEDQQKDYVLAVCEFLEVPAELGVVKLTYMDSGDGRRNLVLYVEKGATDIIRDRRGIDVDSMDEANGKGYVGWKVRGHDKTGRHEMAVGTVSVENLKGKQAADAVMVAQTKALRRMTLAFQGGGFLDSSEINETTRDIGASSLTLAQMGAQPVVLPNAEAGKDITVATPPPAEPLKIGEWGDYLGLQKEDTPLNPIPANTVESSTIITIVPVEKPARKPRANKKRTAVSLDSTTSVAQPAATLAPPHGAVEVVPATEQKGPEPMAVAPALAVTAPPVTLKPANTQPEVKPPTDGGPLPTAEQSKAYYKRLSEYVDDILPSAGFKQSEGELRKAKMGKFFKAMFPTTNTKNLSVSEWDAFFNFMDGTLKSSGAAKLVSVIEGTLSQVAKTKKEEEEKEAE